MGFVSFQRSATTQRATKIIMLIIALIFVAGALFSFGTSRRAGCLGQPSSPVIVRVAGAEITEAAFLNSWNWMSDQDRRLTADPTLVAERKNALLDSFIERSLVEQEASRRGVKPKRDEVRRRINEAVEMRIASLGTGVQMKKALREAGLTLEQFRRQAEDEARANQSTYYYQAMRDALMDAVVENMKAKNPKLAQKYKGKVKTRQIVIRIRPEDAPAPSADNESLGLPRAQAEAKVREIMAKLKEKDADFAAIARKESMDEESRKKGGDVGYVSNDPSDYTLPGPVKDALFQLEPGQISDPIEPPGWNAFYILKAEGLEVDKEAAFAAFLEALKKRVTVEVLDPELQAYRVLIAAKDDADKRKALALYEEALDADLAKAYDVVASAAAGAAQEAALQGLSAELVKARQRMLTLEEESKNKRKALMAEYESLLQDKIAEARRQLSNAKTDQAKAAALVPLYEEVLEKSARLPGRGDKAHICYQIGRIWEQFGEKDQALAAYKTAVLIQESSPTLYIALGQMYRELGQKDNALGAFENASEVGYSDILVHMQLKRIYEDMGQKELAEEEQAAIEEIQKAGGGFGGFPFSFQ